jgi:hypothetical protein
MLLQVVLDSANKAASAVAAAPVEQASMNLWSLILIGRMDYDSLGIVISAYIVFHH